MTDVAKPSEIVSLLLNDDELDGLGGPVNSVILPKDNSQYSVEKVDVSANSNSTRVSNLFFTSSSHELHMSFTFIFPSSSCEDFNGSFESSAIVKIWIT